MGRPIRDRQTHLSERLNEIAQKLRTFLKHVSTAAVIHQFHSLVSMGPDEASKELGLGSPVKQGLHMLSLALGTAEPAVARELSEEQWIIIYRHLREASEAYAALFVPTEAELAAMDPQRRHRYQVVAPAFLHYFHVGELASKEQFLARARNYLARFDADLERIAGLSATDGIQVVEWIGDHLQGRLDAMVDWVETMASLHKEYLASGWSRERLEEELLRRRAEDPDRYNTRDPLLVDLSEMAATFGDARTEAFCEIFAVRRGTITGQTFFAGPNLLEERPLVRVSAESAYCPLANTLYSALVRRFVGLLEADEAVRDRFHKHRDAVLESQVEDVLRTFLGPEAEIFVSTSERPDGQYEHDAVVIWRRTAFVVEAKASPPVEPFRDVDRAFTRMERAFRSKAGIQKAYEQAMRLVRAFEHGGEVVLYGPRGEVARRVAPGEVERSYAICVTADDFGPLAIDLSLLLQKPADEPYPWAVNIFDLEAFLEALRLKGWGPTELSRYLEQRSRLHGRVIASDELEFGGMFLRQGRLPAPQDGAIIRMDPRYSDIFDDIWMAKNGGPPADLASRGDLTLTDATDETRESLRVLESYARELDLGFTSSAKVGRNEPCPCGSNRKFKNCHGRAASGGKPESVTRG